MNKAQQGAAVSAVQAVIVASMNTLGVALAGSTFKLIESSPFSDDQIADMLNEIEPKSGVQYNITACDSDVALARAQQFQRERAQFIQHVAKRRPWWWWFR